MDLLSPLAIGLTSVSEVCPMNVAEIVEKGLAAFLPVYDDGNVTQVLTSSGKQFLVRRTCKTVLKNLARFYNIDLTAAREHYGKAVNKKQGVPIPFASNLLLIPVKARKNPLGENDGTLGYVNYREIRDVEDGKEGSCHIIFKCDKELEVLVSKDTMKEYIKNAQLVESCFLNRHFDGSNGANKNNEQKSIENDEAQLRDYLLKLLLEIIYMQKNQAAK